MPRQRKEPEIRRAEVLAGARQLIIQNGHQAFRLELLLKKLALSKGGFYHHFASVEELLGGLIAQDLEQELAFIGACASIQPATRALQELMRKGSIYAEGDGGILPYLKGDPARQLYTRLLDASFNQAIRLALSQIFENGIRAGEFPPFNVEAAIELFEAINHHANRSVILGRWNETLGANYHRLALQALHSVTGVSFDGAQTPNPEEEK